MKRIEIGLLSVLFLVFLTSCLTAETKDNPAEDQAIYSLTKLDSIKSDSIQHILTNIVNDGKAPGMIAAIISGEGVRAIASATIGLQCPCITFLITISVT